MDSNSAKVADFFNKKAVNNGKSFKSLDWGSKRSQLLRFAVLSEIGAFDNKTVLDVGCGLADFYSYIKVKYPLLKKYVGIDLSNKLIELAKNENPNLEFYVSDILDEKKMTDQKFDYVIGSGIHYYKVEDNKQRTEKLLKNMYDKCNIGVSTNMINKSYGEEKLSDYVYSFEVESVLNYCRTITPYVVVRQDYLPNDFTIYLYKKDFGERNAENFGIYR